MADTEKLHFKIVLGGTYWKKVPVYSILVNDTVVIDKQSITSASGETDTVEFDYEATEGPCILKIRLENKDNSDTVQNDDKTAIVKDLLLSIKGLEVDEIDLGSLLHTKSIFTGDDPARPVLDNCIDLGWNGTWSMQCESPFYIWLLENL